MKTISSIFISLLLILLTSCSSSEVSTETIVVDDGYTSVFPNRETSDELELISNSLVLINNMTFYNSYLYLDSVLTLKDLQNNDLTDKTIFDGTVTKTSSGTGTIINISGTTVSLLTAAHIVSYPDTIMTFYKSEDGKSTQFIESIMVKERQNIYSNLPEGGRLKLIAKDDKTDIAIVGNSFREINSILFPVLDIKLGDSSELNWGDFVYVFGYPMHNKIVTRGIVSLPTNDNSDNFFVDALINRGSSGGIVLAMNGSNSTFELVGVVSSVPAEKMHVLSPENPQEDTYLLPGTVYTGNTTIEKLDNIRYGIGKIASSVAIKNFLIENEDILSREGHIIHFE